MESTGQKTKIFWSTGIGKYFVWLKHFQAFLYFLLLNVHLLQLLRIHPFLWAERVQKIPELVKALGTLEVSSVSVLLPVVLPWNFLAEERYFTPNKHSGEAKAYWCPFSLVLHV